VADSKPVFLSSLKQQLVPHVSWQTLKLCRLRFCFEQQLRANGLFFANWLLSPPVLPQVDAPMCSTAVAAQHASSSHNHSQQVSACAFLIVLTFLCQLPSFNVDKLCAGKDTLSQK